MSEEAVLQVRPSTNEEEPGPQSQSTHREQATTKQSIQMSISDEVQDREHLAPPPLAADADHVEAPSIDSIRDLLGRARQNHPLAATDRVPSFMRECGKAIAVLFIYSIQVAAAASVLLVPVTLYQVNTAETACESGTGVRWLLATFALVSIMKKYCGLDDSCFKSVIFILANVALFTRQPCSTLEHVNLMLLLVAYSEMYFCVLVALCCCGCCFFCCCVLVCSCITGRRPNLNGMFRNKQKALAAIHSIEDQSQLIDCPICFEKDSDSQLPCKHQFHKICIENWFGSKTTCPVCRAEYG